MLNTEKYKNKSFYNDKNQKIIIKDIIEYKGIGLYKVIYEQGFNEPTQYLHDISEIELIDFLNKLNNKKIMEKEINKIGNKSQNDLDKLKDILFITLNDVIEDGITCEKASTVSKMAQTIINLEKINNKIINT
jgi:hypothetical protein